MHIISSICYCACCCNYGAFPQFSLPWTCIFSLDITCVCINLQLWGLLACSGLLDPKSTQLHQKLYMNDNVVVWKIYCNMLNNMNWPALLSWSLTDMPCFLGWTQGHLYTLLPRKGTRKLWDSWLRMVHSCLLRWTITGSILPSITVLD